MANGHAIVAFSRSRSHPRFLHGATAAVLLACSKNLMSAENIYFVRIGNGEFASLLPSLAW
jgi:hypothetical protein